MRVSPAAKFEASGQNWIVVAWKVRNISKNEREQNISKNKRRAEKAEEKEEKIYM